MTLPIAGWYPDPDNAERSRWWNGMAWTDSYAGNPADGVADAPDAPAAPYGAPVNPGVAMPAPAPYGYPAQTLTAPAGTKWSTPWIWLIVVLPFLASLTFFFIDFGKFFNAAMWLSEASSQEINANMDELIRSLFSPAMLLFGLAIWVAAVLNIVFAYFDWRELKLRGVPQPFHWAWSFLQNFVYIIGRSVIVNRRIGKGLSPIWVTIILSVVSSIVFTVYVFTVGASMYQDTFGFFV